MMSSLWRILVWINLMRCLVSTWLSSKSTLLTPDYGFAVGAYDHKIYIIGGYSRPNQVTEYRTESDTFVDVGSDALPTSVSGSGQFWTQRHETVYMLSPSTPRPTIASFNLRTQTFTPWHPVDPSLRAHGCLTSSNDYLFVVGGCDRSTSHPLPTLQAFDFMTHTWIPKAPPMNTPRMYSTCVVNNDYLWALGGHSTDSITSTERVSIANITQNVWTDSDTPSLIHPVLYATAVSHQHFIFIIGGMLNTVQIIDTTTGILSLSSDIMPYAMDSAGCIYDQGKIYVFGGRTSIHPLVSVNTLLYKQIAYNSQQKRGVVYHLEQRAAGDNPTAANSSVSPSQSPSTPPTESESEDAPPKGKGLLDGFDDQMLVLTAVCLGLVVILLLLLLALVCFKRKKEEQINKELEEQYMNNIAMGLQQQEMVQSAVKAASDGGDEMNENDILEQVLALSAFEQRQSTVVDDNTAKLKDRQSKASDKEDVHSKESEMGDKRESEDDNDVVDEGLCDEIITGGAIQDDYKQDIEDVMDRPHAASVIPAGNQRVLDVLTGDDDDDALQEAMTGDHEASDSDDDVLIGVDDTLQTAGGE